MFELHYFGKISYHDLYNMPLEKQEKQYRLLNSQLLKEHQEAEAAQKKVNSGRRGR